MIYGDIPFKSERKILETEIQHVYNTSISNECMDIISKSLKKDPICRITWDDLKSHQWTLYGPPEKVITLPAKITSARKYLVLSFLILDILSKYVLLGLCNPI